MVYNHTLTFVTVFIWRDLFFGYKLVTPNQFTVTFRQLGCGVHVRPCLARVQG